MQIELKPCPFCGCKDFVKVEPCQFPPDEEGDAWQWGYNVVCDASGFEGTPRGCGASSPWQETPDEAVVSWNRRAIEAATPPDVAGLIEQLEQAGAEYRDRLPATSNLFFRAATALRLSAGGVPDGWKLVPVDPTFEMQIAGRDAIMDASDDDNLDLSTDDADACYRAMLAAAPTMEAGHE